ncbi:MAG: hypothetical protein HY319_03030 [Armatimonadetes bacterium]|nr:hypothetical protein [Armatimonadota bacterium]
MLVTRYGSQPLRAEASAPAAPPQDPPAPADQVEPGDSNPSSQTNWSNVAFLAGTTALGAAAGVYGGLNTGILSELIGLAMVPGAAVAGGIMGGIGAEQLLTEKTAGEYRAVGGLIIGGLVGAAAGIVQAGFAGEVASPILATTMGITGGLCGFAYPIM